MVLGIAIGAGIALLLRRPAQVVVTQGPMPPIREQATDVVNARSRVGVRPWTRAPWTNTRPMLAGKHYF